MFFQQDQVPTQTDTPNEIDLNPGLLLEKIDTWLDGFVRLLPNLVVAIVVIVIFYFLGKLARRLIFAAANRRKRKNLGEMLGGLVRYTIIIIGIVLGLTIIIPSLKPGDLIAGLGVSSVAIGFAFKDILQNWLAGLLILIRQPFEIGDQIQVNDFEGTVEKIETRATIIKTFAGVQIVIPNNEIYTNSVKVNTAYDARRSEYDVGIGYGDDTDEAIQAIRSALQKVEGIHQDKGIDILPIDLAASWVTLRVRWWTKSTQSEVIHTMSNVISAIKRALQEALIDMPYDTQVHLFHDQTEDTDGERSKQREGWPSDKEADPKPRWKAEKEEGEKKKEEVTTAKEDKENKIDS